MGRVVTLFLKYLPTRSESLSENVFIHQYQIFIALIYIFKVENIPLLVTKYDKILQ